MKIYKIFHIFKLSYRIVFFFTIPLHCLLRRERKESIVGGVSSRISGGKHSLNIKIPPKLKHFFLQSRKVNHIFPSSSTCISRIHTKNKDQTRRSENVCSRDQFNFQKLRSNKNVYTTRKLV